MYNSSKEETLVKVRNHYLYKRGVFGDYETDMNVEGELEEVKLEDKAFVCNGVAYKYFEPFVEDRSFNLTLREFLNHLCNTDEYLVIHVDDNVMYGMAHTFFDSDVMERYVERFRTRILDGYSETENVMKLKSCIDIVIAEEE